MSDVTLDLMGAWEVCQALGVDEERMNQMRFFDAGFPSLVAELKCGPIWRAEAVKAYAAEVRKRERQEVHAMRKRKEGT